MSCYLRHMGDIISQAGIELTKENRKAVDYAIRRSIGKPDCNCSDVWKEVKTWIADGRRQELVDSMISEYTK